MAREIADLGAPEYTLARLREEWDWSEFDLAADAVVAEAPDGAVVGYAAMRRREAVVAVRPESEGRGVGARLLTWAQARERERGRARHRQWVGAANARARALLEGAGYRPVGSWLRMTRPLGGVVESAHPPDGVRVRPLDPLTDAEAAHALDEVAFAANPEYERESLPEFRAEHLEAHDVDPGLSFVAERDGVAVGFVVARRREDRAGFVDILAVHPNERGRGVGGALLRGAFDAFTAAGMREARLGVAADNASALRLYRRAGMAARFRVDGHERRREA